MIRVLNNNWTVPHDPLIMMSVLRNAKFIKFELRI